MKVKAMRTVIFLMVFAATAIGFSMVPGSLSNAGDNDPAKPFPDTGKMVISSAEDNAKDGSNEIIEPQGTEIGNNTFYGENAGAGNSGSYGAFFGAEAGGAGGTGNSGGSNTFLGQRSGWQNTTGASNTFVGRLAGGFNTSGSYNTFMGRATGYRNTTGDQNTFLGTYAGHSNTEGWFNTFVGYHSGFSSLGHSNTFVGYSAGSSNTTGGGNTCIGRLAGYENETGEGNVFLGYGAGFHETGSNKLYIDNSETGNPLIWGDFSSNSVIIYGSFRAVASYSTSDGRLKRNVAPLESSLDKVSNLQGVSYQWKTDAYSDYGLTEGKQIGLVAQDVQRVLPELVSEDKNGYKAVSYTQLTAVLVEAIKELRVENKRREDLLRMRLKKQQAEIEALRSMIRDLKS